MRIELNCRECGGNRFTIDQHAADNAFVECGECGHKIGTLGELKRQVAEEVLSRSKLVSGRG
jgi:predicted nucleic acid-binding Zn ribbon protein